MQYFSNSLYRRSEGYYREFAHYALCAPRHRNYEKMLFPCGPASQLLNQAVLENTTWQAMLWQSLRAGTCNHSPELWFLWQPASPASAGFAPATHHMGKTAFRQERKMSGMLQLIAPCHFWVPRSETDSTPSLNSGLLAESCTWHYTLMPFGISCA